ncbi:MAG: enoyl-CoA hydratase-related protein [Bacillota bacterium]
MAYETWIMEKTERMAILTINHPPANAVSGTVIRELDQIVWKLQEDTEIRCVIITGAGEKFFCAGADITEFESNRAGGATKVDGNAVLLRLENLTKPVIAAINGYCMGAGLEIALSCHLRIMADSTKLGLPEVKLGIIPGWGGTQRLPRIIGATKALEHILTGDPILPEDALRMGLVNKVVPREKVLEEAMALGRRLAQGAPVAQKAILRGVIRGTDTSLWNGLFIEGEGSEAVQKSKDAAEGSTAFLEKRPPNFKGE